MKTSPLESHEGVNIVNVEGFVITILFIILSHCEFSYYYLIQGVTTSEAFWRLNFVNDLAITGQCPGKMSISYCERSKITISKVEDD